MEAILQKIATTVAPKGEAGAKPSWWRWPLLFVLVLLGLAIAAWLATRNARELAKLRHEKFVRELEDEQLLIDRANDEDQARADAAIAAADAARVRIDEIDAAIAATEARHAKAKEAIDTMLWSDLRRGDDAGGGTGPR